MWVEIIIGGGIVTFSQAGTYLDSLGRDPRCEWAPIIEAEARRISGRAEGIRFTAQGGDLSVRLHEDAVLPVIRAIAQAETSMPTGVRGFYQRICYLLEHGERVRLADLRQSVKEET